MKFDFQAGRWLALAWLAVAGCGKEPVAETAATPAVAATPMTAQETVPAAVKPVVVNETGDMTLVLASLTDAVRKYSVEKRRVPADLNEVITAGYLQGVPPAPAGKKFAINSRREVELVNK